MSTNNYSSSSSTSDKWVCLLPMRKAHKISDDNALIYTNGSLPTKLVSPSLRTIILGILFCILFWPEFVVVVVRYTFFLFVQFLSVSFRSVLFLRKRVQRNEFPMHNIKEKVPEDVVWCRQALQKSKTAITQFAWLNLFQLAFAKYIETKTWKSIHRVAEWNSKAPL